MNRYIVSFVLCFSLILVPGYTATAEIAVDTLSAADHGAQKAERTITYEEWNDLTNDDAFNYRTKVEQEKVEEPKRNYSGWYKFWYGVLAWLGSTVGKVVIWTLLIAVILFAVYKVLTGDRSSIFGRSSKVMSEDTHALIEDINDTNWEKLLEKAAKEGDLRLSVRYSYMLLLRILQDSELILYREDKTNFQYISELADTQYKQPFRTLSRQYEYTWYGEYPISADSYNEYIAAIMDIKKKLGR